MNDVTENISQADREFEDLTTEFLADQYATHPVMATMKGVHEYDEYLDSFQRFAIRDDRDQVRGYLHAIDKISLADLSFENRVDYRLARSDAQMILLTLEQLKWPETHPGRYLDTVLYGLFVLVTREFAEPDSRALGLLGRLRAVPQAFAEAKQNLQKPPRLYVEIAAEQAEAGDALFADTLPAFFATLPSTDLRVALEEAAAPARAALADFARFLRETVLPRSTEDFALGKERFDYWLRVGHFMQETSDDLLEIGQEAIEEARRELAAVAERIEPGTDWETLVTRFKATHPAPDGLIAAYQTEMQKARNFVEFHRMMTLPTDESLRVVSTPVWARPLLPYAAYMPPAPFEVRQAGEFWVTPLPDNATPEQQEALLQGHCTYTIPTIALHEAYPGHHLQISRANQTPSRFRRHFAHSNLFIEGWALYCEELMWEHGFLSDPRIRLMQLKARLWRACRVVLDVQMHTRGMSLADAAQFLQEVAKLEEVHAQAEVRRYALSPTQPMTYVMGYRALMALRDESMRRLGTRFLARRFHDQLLNEGSLPPTLLREALFSLR